MKDDAYTLYKAKRRDKIGCEIDHLISRDVGGADDPMNLWPQPWAEAHLKDHVESEEAGLRSGRGSGTDSADDGDRLDIAVPGMDRRVAEEAVMEMQSLI